MPGYDKQCRSWWDVSSGSTLFAKISVLECRDESFMINTCRFFSIGFMVHISDARWPYDQWKGNCYRVGRRYYRSWWGYKNYIRLQQGIYLSSLTYIKFETATTHLPRPSLSAYKLICAATWENVPSDVCAQRRLKPACHSLIRVFVVCMKTVASLPIRSAPSENSDQTARRHRLFWIFAGRTCPKVHFLKLRLFDIL